MDTPPNVKWHKREGHRSVAQQQSDLSDLAVIMTRFGVVSVQGALTVNHYQQCLLANQLNSQ